jgi:Uncharacterized conserved protein
MKIQSACVPCLMKRVVFQSRLPNNGREFEAIKAALKAYGENISEDMNSAKIATIVHRSAYDALGVADPYLELKIRADEVMSKYMEISEKYVAESEDKIRAAIKISIIGNIMDFGSGIAIDDPSEFEEMFETLLDQELGIDDTEAVKDILIEDGAVIYLFDNCGESQLDKVLIREIRKLGRKVVGVVRGEAILNDVTYEDAVRIGLDEEVDEMLTTGAFAIGVDMDRIGEDLRKSIEEASIIIAKGMANYESLSDLSLKTPVAYLMKAKCVPVAESLGVTPGTNVVRLT